MVCRHCSQKLGSFCPSHETNNCTKSPPLLQKALPPNPRLLYHHKRFEAVHWGLSSCRPLTHAHLVFRMVWESSNEPGFAVALYAWPYGSCKGKKLVCNARTLRRDGALSTHAALWTGKSKYSLQSHWRFSTEYLQGPLLIEFAKIHMNSDLIQSVLHHMSFNIDKIFFSNCDSLMEPNESERDLNENQSRLFYTLTLHLCLIRMLNFPKLKS